MLLVLHCPIEVSECLCVSNDRSIVGHHHTVIVLVRAATFSQTSDQISRRQFDNVYCQVVCWPCDCDLLTRKCYYEIITKIHVRGNWSEICEKVAALVLVFMFIFNCVEMICTIALLCCYAFLYNFTVTEQTF